MSEASKEVVVAVMGATGAGKSTFIKTITGRDDVVAGHGLTSQTSEVQSYRFRHQGINYVLVDTPGFDDTYMPDEEVVKILLEWLERSYRGRSLLNGVVYIHRLSEPRMQGTALKNLRMFRKICGKEALANVILAESFWEALDPATVEQRDQELRENKNFWGRMISEGSQVMRLGLDRSSCLAILKEIAKNHKVAFQAQREIVEEGASLDQTVASALHSARATKEFEVKINGMRKVIMEEMLKNQGNPVKNYRMRSSLNGFENLDSTMDADEDERRSRQHQRDMEVLKNRVNEIKKTSQALQQQKQQLGSRSSSRASSRPPRRPQTNSHKDADCKHRPRGRPYCSGCGRAIPKTRYYHCCSCSNLKAKSCFLHCENCGSQCPVFHHPVMEAQEVKGFFGALGLLFSGD